RMARIASESKLAHLGIDRAPPLGIWCARIEMFAPNEGSSLVEFQPRTRWTRTGATESLRHWVGFAQIRGIRVPSTLDSFGAVGSRLIAFLSRNSTKIPNLEYCSRSERI
ncbi:MAG TPA: hypothetical protein VH539_16015, partial [Gemmatimonadaceae bacterium]